MRRQIAIVALLLFAASNEFVLAADPRYPDWPCTQAKVPEISLAAVWAGPPLDDIKGKWKDDAKVSALVPKLAARRTSIEDGQKAIAEYGRPEYADLIANNPIETPLTPDKMVVAFRRWDEEVGTKRK